MHMTHHVVSVVFFCEFECAEKLAKIMLKDENMNKGRVEMIESLEQEIVQEYKMKSGINMELKNRLQAAIISLDRGNNEESLIEICSLAYLPTWAAHKFPQNTERKQIENWVRLEIYESSLEKQSEVTKAIQISGCAATRTCNSLFVNMKQAEMHYIQKHRQTTHMGTASNLQNKQGRVQ